MPKRTAYSFTIPKPKKITDFCEKAEIISAFSKFYGEVYGHLSRYINGK
ncbi:hypothetical protein [Pseudolactococcus hodotermopsidis]|nr:hypothetical protein [Lactococcus hodotermopsidis]